MASKTPWYTSDGCDDLHGVSFLFFFSSFGLDHGVGHPSYLWRTCSPIDIGCLKDKAMLRIAPCTSMAFLYWHGLGQTSGR
jgi:hypothetical protein